MQIVNIDLIPQIEKPIVNLSQYDNDRQVHFNLFENGLEYTLSGTETIDVNIRKPDGNIVVINPKVTANKYVDVLFTEQSTACHGKSFGEISIKENSTIIGTCNFIMDVEKSPTCGGIESASEINNLQTQIDNIISDEGYLKSDDVAEVALSGDYSDLFNAPDPNNYYDKNTVNTLLATKANTSDLATVATSGDYDDLINKPTIPAAQIQSDWSQSDNTKVDYIKNKPTIPTKTSDLLNDSDFQSEMDVNNLIAAALLAVMPVDSATGNPCSFDTDIATSLVGLSAEIVASGGNGTPSTPIPIVGHSAVNLVHTGANLININGSVYAETKNPDTAIPFVDGLVIKGISRDGYVRPNNVTFTVGTDKVTINSNSTSYGLGLAFRAVANAEYYVSTENDWYGACSYYDKDGYNIGFTSFMNGNRAFTTPSNCAWCVIIITPTTTNTDTDFIKPQVNVGSTATAYAPYNGTLYLVQFGQTVYGGVYDANRGKVKPNVYYPSYNGETINGRWLSSKDVYVEGNTPTTGAQVVCLDEYDTEIDVSELSVAAIVGTNNITSDCNGDVTASYKVSIQKYIDDRT